MIDQITGIAQSTNTNSLVMCINGFCLRIATPHCSHIKTGEEITLFTHLHWNTETGPSLYGFKSDVDRATFLLITEVPKIGPKIALAILEQLSSSQIISALQAGNTELFNGISGIGPKKAQHITMYLQDKATKLIAQGCMQQQEDPSLVCWQQLNNALLSLGYTKQEITHATNHLAQITEGKKIIFDQLLRSALAFLSRQTI